MPAIHPDSCCLGLWLMSLVYHSAFLFAYQVSDTLKCFITKVVISFQQSLKTYSVVSFPSTVFQFYIFPSKFPKNRSGKILLKASGKGHFDGD